MQVLEEAGLMLWVNFRTSDYLHNKSKNLTTCAWQNLSRNYFNNPPPPTNHRIRQKVLQNCPPLVLLGPLCNTPVKCLPLLLCSSSSSHNLSFRSDLPSCSPTDRCRHPSFDEGNCTRCLKLHSKRVKIRASQSLGIYREPPRLGKFCLPLRFRSQGERNPQNVSLIKWLSPRGEAPALYDGESGFNSAYFQAPRR